MGRQVVSSTALRTVLLLPSPLHPLSTQELPGSDKSPLTHGPALTESGPSPRGEEPRWGELSPHDASACESTPPNLSVSMGEVKIEGGGGGGAAGASSPVLPGSLAFTNSPSGSCDNSPREAAYEVAAPPPIPPMSPALLASAP
ncbi:MAG: hypothetical protein SGPRY_003397, partial [Prymnesium sp.]